MKIAELQEKLITVARADRPDESVPYAFEQRIMARLRQRTVPDRWTSWARWMWQAAVPCLGLTAVLCALALSSGASNNTRPNLSEQFETTVYAAIDYPETSW